MEEEEILKIIHKGLKEAFSEFQGQIKEQIEHEFKNGERIAKFLTKLEERQEILCKNLEQLAKITKQFLECLKRGSKIEYAS